LPVKTVKKLVAYLTSCILSNTGKKSFNEIFFTQTWKIHLSAVFLLTKFISVEPGPDPAAASTKFLIWFLLLHEDTEGAFILFPPAETCLFYITFKIKLPESTLIRRGKDKQQPSDPN